jgi:arabinogalactan oligomer/maltooligosaccharide transport system permease protein
MADARSLPSGVSKASSETIVAVDRSLPVAVATSSRKRGGIKPRSLATSAASHAVLILFSIIFVFPMLSVVLTSFKADQIASDVGSQFFPAHPTLDNYKYVLSSPAVPFFSWLTNSLGVAVATMILGVLIALPAAYALSRFEFLGKQGVLLSFLITQMFPGALLLVPLFALFTNFGATDHPYALVIAYATTTLPFSVYMLKNFFDTVPRELDQAGLIDGLGTFGVFWRIVAPLTIPGIAVVAFFNFMNSWNEFMLARAFLSQPSSLTLPVALNTFVNQFQIHWGYLTAMAILVTIPVFVLFIWAQRYLITGLTGGSVKG